MIDRRGLTLEQPELRIRWGIRPRALQAVFEEAAPSAGLKRVTAGYYVVRCTALRGLRTMMGFHFQPQSDDGTLVEVEFFDNGLTELRASFSLYQDHLEKTFGRPSRVSANSRSAEFRSYLWWRGRVRVSQWVRDRFGPEEHVRVFRRGWLSAWLP